MVIEPAVYWKLLPSRADLFVVDHVAMLNSLQILRHSFQPAVGTDVSQAMYFQLTAGCQPLALWKYPVPPHFHSGADREPAKVEQVQPTA